MIVPNFGVLRVLTAVTLLSAAALLAGCDRPPEPTIAETKAALTVELVSPALAQWPEQIEASGSIAAWHESTISAEVADLKLDEVLVDVGDVVTKGQLLARFNADTAVAELALAEATVAQMEAASALANDKTARARRLEGTISQEIMIQYEAEGKMSTARLTSAQAQRQLQQLRLRHTEVRAPDDGVISARTATVGLVTGSGTELFKLIRQRRLEWRAVVPADQLARVRPGQPVTLMPTGQPALPGFVRQTSPVVDAGTLNGLVYVDLREAASLRAGMFVSGQLQLPATPVLHLPESALVFRDGFQYLMKIDASNRVHQIKVSTGRRLGQSVEILSETLTAVHRIVRSGGSFLNEGESVRVMAAKAAPVSVAAPSIPKGEQP